MKTSIRYGMVFLLGLLCLSWTVLGAEQAPSAQELQKIKEAVPSQAAAQKPLEPRRLLVIDLCMGYWHSSIPYWNAALTAMGEQTGAFETQIVSDMGVFTAEGLKDVDAVCFNNTTNLKFNDAQKQALMDFVKGGKGVVGIHAGADNFNNWPEAQEMMGNIFTGHPWTAGGTWAIKIDDPDHPLMKPFEGKGFSVNDEIYRTRAPLYSRDKVRVLMSLDMSDEKTRTAEGVEPGDEDTGISWIRTFGQGRVFYCGLGHNHQLTWTPAVLEHVLLGVQYAFGDLKADATPAGGDELTKLLDQAKDYEFGRSGEVLTQIENEIAAAGSNPDSLKTVEAKLLGALQGQGSFAFRDFLCRRLSLIGSEQSVGPLMALLEKGEKEANIARFALERIPSPAVDAALLKRLPSAEPEIQIGIITTLGARQSDEATDAIGGLLKSTNADVVAAAVSALGRIGSEKAADQLDKQIDSLPSGQKTAAMDALLQCAGQLRQQGDAAGALAIYQTLFAKDNPTLIRLGALAGITQTADSAKAGEALLTALDDSNLEIQSGAIWQACRADNAKTIAEINSRMDQLPELLKVRFLSALDECGRPVGRAIAVQSLKDSSQAVQSAAIEALTRLGDETSVAALAKAAANTSNRQIRDLARTALDQVDGAKANRVIVQEIEGCRRNAADNPVCQELIGAAGRRRIDESLGLLTEIAGGENRDLRRPSLQSIQQIAGPRDLEPLIGLLKDRPDDEVENTIVIVASKQEAPQGRASTLVKAYEQTSDPAEQAAILRVLGRIGDPAGYGMIRNALGSDDAKVRQGAQQGLFGWTGPEAINDLKPLVLNGEDDRTKVLAFRAYLRVLREAGLSNESLVSEAAWAMKTAPRPDERKGVLAILSDQSSSNALALVMESMEEPSLRGEAETAAVSICQKLLASDPQQARAVLVKIQENTSNDSIKGKIEEILKRQPITRRRTR